MFDGLSTGRLDSAEFLRRDTTDEIFSRPDLQLLEDLRDSAALTVARTEPVDAEFVKRLNTAIPRSGSLNPAEGAPRGRASASGPVTGTACLPR